LLGKSIHHHNQYRPFLFYVSKKFNSQEIVRLFDLIEKLHVNFYEGYLSPQEVEQRYLDAQKIINEINSLVKKVRKKGKQSKSL